MRVAVVLFLSSLAVLAQSEPTNPLKRTLAEGKPVVGLTVTLASADVAVQAASLGFDFIWIEMEHSPITLETAHNMILATRGANLVPLVRVPVNELWTAKRALDVGALGVIFPFTSTPELARQAVAACKYPPLGKRGYGPGLASMRWPAPEGYAAFANANSFVVVIIETAEAIRNIEEIAATPGIDVLFIGVNDLSYSLGRGGKLDDPEVKAAVGRVLEAGRKNGVPVGRPATAAQVQELMKDGFRFFQAPSDLALLAVGAKPLLDAVGKKAPDLKSRPLY